MARKLRRESAMNHSMFFKTDTARRIDGVIDYFGEAKRLTLWRKTWLTRGRDSQGRRLRREPARLFAMR